MDRSHNAAQTVIDLHGACGAGYTHHVGQALIREDILQGTVNEVFLDMFSGDPDGGILEGFDVIIDPLVGPGGNGDFRVIRIVCKEARFLGRHRRC